MARRLSGPGFPDPGTPNWDDLWYAVMVAVVAGAIVVGLIGGNL